MKTPRRARSTSLLARLSRRGASMVEYTLVLSAIAIPTLVGVSIAGHVLYKSYVKTRDHVVRPTP